MQAIQYVDDCDSEQSAGAALQFLAAQVCYLGRRLLPPCNQIGRDRWRVQSFHDCQGIDSGALLPLGCRLVFIPQGSRKALGIR